MHTKNGNVAGTSAKTASLLEQGVMRFLYHARKQCKFGDCFNWNSSRIIMNWWNFYMWQYIHCMMQTNIIVGLSWKLRNFKNGCHFGVGVNFLPGSGTGIWRVIEKNVPMSFKHEYRRPILSPLCDVISDVISMRNIFHAQFAYGLSIFMSNWSYIEQVNFLKVTKCWGPDEVFRQKCHRKEVMLPG